MYDLAFRILERLKPLTLPQAGDGLIHCYARKPGSERRFAPILTQVLEGADVSVLQYIFSLTVAAGDGTRRAVEPLVVAAHDHLEQAGIARKHALHHLLVGELLVLRAGVEYCLVHGWNPYLQLDECRWAEWLQNFGCNLLRLANSFGWRQIIYGPQLTIRLVAAAAGILRRPLRRRPRQILSFAHELGPIPEPAGREDPGRLRPS